MKQVKVRSMKEEKRCCGNCCWFCFEDAYGEGQCVEVDDDGYPMMATMCNCHACERFVSRKEMRHHMAVLLQYNRWLQDWVTVKRNIPDKVDLMDATSSAYRYMKVFNKL